MSHLHAVALDVETTGFDPTEDAVVDLAAVDIGIDPATGQYDALETLFTSLVDPKRDIPAAASAVHHLTARDVQGQPDLAQARAGLQAAVRDFQPAVAGVLTPGDPRWVCTYRLARHLWPLAKDGFGLQALRYACRLQDHVAGHDAHRAAFAAACCALLLTVECRALTEAGHAVTPALLCDWSAAVPLLARVPFGHYSGRYWDEVPRDYLEWILRKHRSGRPFNPEIVATAEAALRGVYAVPPEQPDPCAQA